MESPTPTIPIPKRYSINHKVLAILFVAFICYIPTLFIQGLVADRIYHQEIAMGTADITTETITTTGLTWDEYRSIDRVTKYAVLFISLTFALFFLFEVLAKTKIHPINYGLVGLALGVFYLLLLSLAEQIGFIPAYVIAASATVTLICTYIVRTLASVTKTSLLAALLATLYGYLLVLLQLEQYSLLFGSLLVFATLATIMLSTRDIDWYDV